MSQRARRQPGAGREERISEIRIAESHRVRLIGDLAKLIGEGSVPEPMRTAGLSLIGYLARRFPGEAAHQLGVAEARRFLEEQECFVTAAVKRRRS